MEPPPLEYSIFIREVTGNLPEFPSCEKQPYSEGRWFYVELHCRNYRPPGPGAIGIVNDDGRLGSVAWMHSLFVTEWIRRAGAGTAVIEAAGERWPNLTWTSTSEDSQGFHDHLVRAGVARWNEEMLAYEFVPQAKRKTRKAQPRSADAP
jgi:hypothetical protein